jgi:hypothetical protein
MVTQRVWMRTLLFATLISVCAGCSNSSTPVAPTPPPVSCSSTITIGLFPNGSPASPGQGMEWTSYFAATLLPSQATVYIVDVNNVPVGCLGGAWTAVASNRDAVNLSPAGGTGRGQVELFIPANTGAPRSTDVTIAGERGTVVQAGR